jgi:parallel beta-helix repeat protein
MKKLFLILSLCFANGVWASIIYVDNITTNCSLPTDNDYDNVTRTCGGGNDIVYDSIQGAATVATAGDTVSIREGTYIETVVPANSGDNATGYITYQAYDDTEVVIIQRPNGKDNCIRIPNTGRKYLYFKNLTLQGASGEESVAFVVQTWSNGTATADHIILDGLNILNSYIGVAFWGRVSDSEVKNSTFNGNQYGTRLYSYNRNILIHNNTFDNGTILNRTQYKDTSNGPVYWSHHIVLWSDANLIPFEPISDVKITNNTVLNSKYQGILVLTSKNVLVKDNYCAYNKATGIQIEAIATSGWVGENIIVEDNLCEYNSQAAKGETGIWIDENDNVLVQNNIIRSNNTGMVISGSFNVIARNNEIYANDTGSDISWTTGYGILITGSFERDNDTQSDAGGGVVFIHNTLHANGFVWENASGNVYGGQVSINNPTFPEIENCVFKNNIASESKFGPELDLYVSLSNSLNYNNFFHPNGPQFLKVKWQGDMMTWDDYVSESDNDTNSITYPPLFNAYDRNDLDNADLSLKANSPCIEAGDFLTITTNSGTNSKNLEVEDARYFSDGFDVIDGDLIQIGSSLRRVVDVNYDNNTITLDNNTTWSIDDSVSYPYEGNRPDIGAYEYPEDNDTDSDGYNDIYDNCPFDSNSGQGDTDNDTIGDDCDNCPNVENTGQYDFDNDGTGDACDTCTDSDGDDYGNPGFSANTCDDDNCPSVSNSTQDDSDADSFGDACDNCPARWQPNQIDSDSDGIGNWCDN